MQDANLFPGMEAAAVGAAPQDEPTFKPDPRLRRPDRFQMFLDPVCLDEMLPQNHPARLIWAAVQKLDLSAFYEPLKARGSTPGRAATEPKVLIALWLYAATRGVGSGRELARLCRYHAAYRWLCGGISLNYHTLNDFRVGYEGALDELLTQVVAGLIFHGVVRVRRVSQDGVRVRAAAGSSSFRRREKLEDQLVEVRGHIEALKRRMEAPTCSRLQAAQTRGLRERQRRLEAALSQLPKIEAAKASSKHKPSPDRPTRVSSTDPEARVMHMADGGFRPAYNVQFAADTDSRAIVGVDVTNAGTDANQATPMRQQVEDRTECKVEEHLVDGGYVTLQEIERATDAQTTVYAPPPASKKAASPYAPRETDSEAVAAWRQRMATPEAKEIYKLRGSTSETVNADLRAHRGMGQFNVRGIDKVRCVVLWLALAYNLMHFGAVIVGQ